ncbi:hypothetical protein Tsp_13929, partial [Trichinella spiralis]
KERIKLSKPNLCWHTTFGGLALQDDDFSKSR